MTDFFVSYAGQDRPWAEWISWQVEQAGYRVSVQAWDVVPGSNLVERMQHAIVEAERTIAVLSPAYLTSVHGTAEWLAVWQGDPSGEARALVPVRVLDCAPTGLLATRVAIDLVGLDEGAARRQLLAGLTDAISGNGRPATAPPFPATPDRPAPPFPGSAAGSAADPALTELIDRVAELCTLRNEGARVSRRTDGDGPPYLDVAGRDRGLPVRWPIGVLPSGLTETALASFVEQVHRPFVDRYATVESEIVYAGDRAPDDLIRVARRSRVQVWSLTEYAMLWDSRGYIERMVSRLDEDTTVYPPSLYVPQRYRKLDEPDGTAHGDVLGAVLRWLDADDARLMLVLGDFGHGKTFLLRQLARAIPQQLPHLTPVLVELRALEKGHTLDELVASHLVRAGESRVEVSAFRHMLAGGQIALLFDGFDELALRVTYERAADNLQTLLSAARGRAKVVITSRTQHFASDAQIRTELGQQVELQAGSQLVELTEFDVTQIRAFLLQRYGGDEDSADVRLRLIKEIPYLLALSRNPRMLSFIADLDESRLHAVQVDEGEVSKADLYRELLGAWLGYEARRGRPTRDAAPNLDVDERWVAVTELALRLWMSTEHGVGVDELRETTAQVLTSLADKRLEPAEAAHVIGSGTLLAREDDGKFSFVHSSVMEYLVAVEAARRLDDAAAGPNLLNLREMSAPMIDFLCGAAGDRHALEWASATLATYGTSQAARANALAINARLGARFARAKLAGTDLRGRDITGRDLRLADLSRANLSGARLVNADLSGAVLRGAALANAVLDGTRLARADLSDADLTGALLTNVDLTGARLAGSRWHRAILLGGSIDDNARAGAELAEAAIPGRDLAELMLPPGGSPGATAFSPDGGLLAAAWGSAVAIVDVRYQDFLRVLAGHQGRVCDVAFSPDGRLVASGGDDGTVRVWQVASGRVQAMLRSDGTPVRGVAFSPDGRFVASACDDGTLRMWEVSTGQWHKVLFGHRGALWTVAFSPDGRQVASAGDDGTVRVWQLGSGRERAAVLARHQGDVRGVTFSPNGELVASAGDDGAVRLWRVGTGREHAVLAGHSGPARCVAFSPDGDLVASAGDDGVLLWRVDRGREHATLTGHDGAVRSVAISPAGDVVASTGDDGTLQLHRLDRRGDPVVLGSQRNPVWGVALSPAADMLAMAGPGRTVRLWEVRTGRQRTVLTGHRGTVLSVAFSGDGRTLASAGTDGTVRLWSPSGGEQVLTGHESGVWAVAFSPDGRQLASAGDDKKVQLWSVGGSRRRELSAHWARVRAVAFSPDGRHVASAGDDEIIWLWSTGRGRHRALRGHEGRVRDVAFSPSSDLIVSAGDDGTVQLWNTLTGAWIGSSSGHRDRVWTVAFSPDGQLIASAGDDGTIRLWNAGSGRDWETLTGHSGTVTKVAFNASGAVLASAGEDGTVRLWDVRTRQETATLQPLVGGWAVLLPDGSYKTGGEVGDALWWTVKLSRFPPGALDPYLPSIRKLAEHQPIPAPAGSASGAQ